MNVDEILSKATVRVSGEAFAVVRCGRVPERAFAVVRDREEITAVIPETALDLVDAADIEPGWRLLTFDVVLPFGLVGFLARVATVLAEAEVAVFVLSSFSTDHVLVKNEDLRTACASLEQLGCSIQM